MTAARFGRVDDALRCFVDNAILPGAALAVLVDGELVHQSCVGWADRERRIALREDHLFRVFSNTKLVTACAALLLVQDGLLELDAPIARHLPMLANLPVLRAGATSLTDVEAAARPLTARHLLTHTAGFMYAGTRPGTLLGEAYQRARILLDHDRTLADFVDDLATLPLLFQPGSNWEYSVCSDVLARLIEVVSGDDFASFIGKRLFAPLGMHSTGFTVADGESARLATLYRASFPGQPLRGGLQRCDDIPYTGAYLTPCALRSGGGGLLSTLGDMCALVRSLAWPRHPLLSTASRRLLLENQLPAGMPIRFPSTGVIAGRGYSCGGAVTLAETLLDPAGARGETQWGGIAGTHWWISPATNSAVVLMTQRYQSFWHHFAFKTRREVYAALAAAGPIAATCSDSRRNAPPDSRPATPPAAPATVPGTLPPHTPPGHSRWSARFPDA